MTDGPEIAQAPDRRILYFADPMCSWCWGFSPVIGAIADAVRGCARVKVVVGGLRPGTTKPMSESSKAYIRHHWDQVRKETGQPFDFAFFEREDFVYDTEPACRAVVVVRSIAPAEALPYFGAVQRAFYAGDVDVTSGDRLADLAADHVDAAVFRDRFPQPQAAAETRSDFALAQSLGISGFPCVVLADDDGYRMLSAGYQPFEWLQEPLETWLAS